MKRIVFLDQCLGGGGAERVMCTIMRSLDPKEFEIHLVLVTDLRELKHLVPEQVTVHELGISNTRKALPGYIKAIRGLCPDIVFSTTGRATILAVVGRFFCPVHRLIARYPNMPTRQISSGELSSWRLLLTRILYRYADVIIAQTDEMASELKECFKLPSRKVRTIPNPIDTKYIQQCVEGQTNPFDPNQINIVASGALIKQKGFDLLIDAFVVAKSRNVNVTLHILGGDFFENAAKLKAQGKRLGVLDSVMFYGFVSNPYPYYKYCDLFVLSSRWEGFPNVLLECLCLGKRVVATRCVPIVERLIPDNRGRLANVEDADSLADAISSALLLPDQIASIDECRSGIEHFITVFREG